MGNFFVNKKPQELLRLGCGLRAFGTVKHIRARETQKAQLRLWNAVVTPLDDCLRRHFTQNGSFCRAAEALDDF